VEYLVRPARITDVDRLVALAERELRVDDGEGPLAAADLLRQLVYLPQASVLVAEARRGLAGGVVLALRPSIRAGGYVGTVDLLVVDGDHDADGVVQALLEEVLRSAGNKGCSVVEASLPGDPAMLERWKRQGFAETGPRIERAVTALSAGRART
jgi:predicted N-acetyltransferase YhbS